MTFITRIVEYGEKPGEIPNIDPRSPMEIEKLRDQVPLPAAIGAIRSQDDIHHLFRDSYIDMAEEAKKEETIT